MSKEQFDEKMDELSREAANLQGLPYSEEAWQQMEALLNQKEKRRRAIIWWWLAPLALLLIGGGIYFAAAEKNKKALVANADKKAPTTSTNNKTENVNPTNKTLAGTPADNSSDKKKDIATKNIDSNEALISKTKPAKQSSTVFKKQLTYSNGNSEVITNKARVANSKKLKPNGITSFKNEASKQEINVVTPPTDVQNTMQANNVNSNVYAKDTALSLTVKAETSANKNIQPPEGIAKKTTDSNNTITATKQKPKAKKSILSKFEISISAATDITTVQFKRAEKISTAYGVGISFFASKKLSITTGIGFAKKLYNADSADYKSVPYFTRYARVQNIAADCRVIEVPINVQYLLKQNKNSSWWAAVGLSNYFMQSENYVYSYTESGVPKTATYIFEHQNNHLLSILNLAVAYRKKINQQFSWQLSPFAKLPLNGIGQGQIQLSSFGLQGSLHFGLKK
jgi:hypothetical protein